MAFPFVAYFCFSDALNSEMQCSSLSKPFFDRPFKWKTTMLCGQRNRSSMVLRDHQMRSRWKFAKRLTPTNVSFPFLL